MDLFICAPYDRACSRTNAAVLIIFIGLILWNLLASIRIFESSAYPKQVKPLLVIFIWILPFFGALLAMLTTEDTRSEIKEKNNITKKSQIFKEHTIYIESLIKRILRLIVLAFLFFTLIMGGLNLLNEKNEIGYLLLSLGIIGIIFAIKITMKPRSLKMTVEGLEIVSFSKKDFYRWKDIIDIELLNFPDWPSSRIIIHVLTYKDSPARDCKQITILEGRYYSVSFYQRIFDEISFCKENL